MTAKKTHFHIDTYDLLKKFGLPILYNIFAPKIRKPRIGFALVFTDLETKECLIWDVDIDPMFRRKGAGSALLTGIKAEHNAAVSAYKSVEGERLAIKNGFKREVSPAGNAQMVWRKEEKDDKK